jgi:adenylate cyclase
LSALSAISRNVAALNGVLLAEIGEDIRFGIGIHCGAAIVGGIGYGTMRTFTTLGDAANVAARLEGLCKGFNCEAVISHDVCRIADVSTAKLPAIETELRGRSASLEVHPIERIDQLAGLLSMPDHNATTQLRPA